MSEPYFYKPSGSFSAVQLFRALMGVLPVTILVGIVYALVAFYIPSAQLTTAAVIGAAALVGWLVQRLVIQTKVRSTLVAGIAGLIGGVAAWWSSWVVWIFALFGYDGQALLFDPVFLFGQVVPVLAEDGVWSLGRNGEVVRGAALWTCWIIEAVLLIGGAVLLPYRSVRRTPFSETANDWATEVEGFGPLSGLDSSEIDSLKHELASGELGTLRTLAPIHEVDVDQGFTFCTVRSVPGFDDEHFLSLRRQTCIIVNEKKGEVSAKDQVVFRNLVIDGPTHEELVTKYAEPLPSAINGDEPADLSVLDSEDR